METTIVNPFQFVDCSSELDIQEHISVTSRETELASSDPLTNDQLKIEDDKDRILQVTSRETELASSDPLTNDQLKIEDDKDRILQVIDDTHNSIQQSNSTSDLRQLDEACNVVKVKTEHQIDEVTSRETELASSDPLTNDQLKIEDDKDRILQVTSRETELASSDPLTNDQLKIEDDKDRILQVIDDTHNSIQQSNSTSDLRQLDEACNLVKVKTEDQIDEEDVNDTFLDFQLDIKDNIDYLEDIKLVHVPEQNEESDHGRKDLNITMMEHFKVNQRETNRKRTRQTAPEHIEEYLEDENKKTNRKRKKQKMREDSEEENNKQILIVAASKYSDGRRHRNKLHCCKLCKKHCNGITRHMLSVHKDDADVRYILSLKDKRKRNECLQQIEREGDYNHNKRVIASGNGELILLRRPTGAELKTHTYEDYGPCAHCLGFMLKAHMWHHVKYKCKAKSTSVKTPLSVRLDCKALLAAGIRDTFSPQFEQHVVGKFLEDDIGKAVMKEDIILKYGNFLFQKKPTIDPHQRSKSVRFAMRLLMTLYLRLKNKTSIESFEDIFEPSLFTTVTESVKEMCDCNGTPKKDVTSAPSTAVRVGLELKKLGEFVHQLHTMTKDTKNQMKVKHFVYLVKSEWSTIMSPEASSLLEQRKYKTAELIPITNDLLKLNQHLKVVCESSRKQLESEVNPRAYRSLCEALLVRIVLFNKRRSSESSKMKVKQFIERGLWEKQMIKELKESLSKTERDLAEMITLGLTKGKTRAKAPVLLTAEMRDLLELVIKVRHLHGIDKTNPFIFARPYPAITPLSEQICFKKLSLNAGLVSTERITTTKLHKYVASVCQLLNLTENETDWMARYLGHDFRLQGQHYGLQESTLMLTIVSRILLAIDKGKANRFIGKKLEEINVDELSDVEEDVEETEEARNETCELEDEEDLEETKEDRNGTCELEDEEDYSIEDVPQKNVVQFDLMSEEGDSEKITRSKAPWLAGKQMKCHLRPRIKVPWMEGEKRAVLEYFRETIEKREGVQKIPAEKCIAENSVLKSRTWLNVRDCVRNHIRKITKLNQL